MYFKSILEGQVGWKELSLETIPYLVGSKVKSLVETAGFHGVAFLNSWRLQYISQQRLPDKIPTGKY